MFKIPLLAFVFKQRTFSSFQINFFNIKDQFILNSGELKTVIHSEN